MEYIGKMMWIGKKPNKDRHNPKTHRITNCDLRIDEETIVASWSVITKKIDRKRFIRLAMCWGIPVRTARKLADAVKVRKIPYTKGYFLLEEFFEKRVFTGNE